MGNETWRPAPADWVDFPSFGWRGKPALILCRPYSPRSEISAFSMSRSASDRLGPCMPSPDARI